MSLAGAGGGGSVLFLDGVSFVYVDRRKSVSVLDGFSVDVRPGERVALLGPSGSGKSTILDIASGIRRPNSGTGRLLGHDLLGSTQSELSRLRLNHVARVYQDFQLLDNLTALDNAAIVLRLRGEQKEVARGLAREALERVGMGRRVGHRRAELSGGEQQRVAIARALVARPDLLLADEPTGSLDAGLRDEIMDLMLEVLSRAAIVTVTHDPLVAGRMSRIIRVVPAA